MEAGALCRFLSLVPVSPVQNTGLPLLKSILPSLASHLIPTMPYNPWKKHPVYVFYGAGFWILSK